MRTNRTDAVIFAGDDRKVYEHLAQDLAGNNIFVMAVSSVHEFMALARTVRPSVIVLDSRFDGIAGDTLLPLLKVVAPDAPVIHLASEGGSVSERRCRSLGIAFLVLKPDNLDNLQDLVLQAIRGKAS